MQLETIIMRLPYDMEWDSFVIQACHGVDVFGATNPTRVILVSGPAFVTFLIKESKCDAACFQLSGVKGSAAFGDRRGCQGNGYPNSRYFSERLLLLISHRMIMC